MGQSLLLCIRPPGPPFLNAEGYMLGGECCVMAFGIQGVIARVQLRYLQQHPQKSDQGRVVVNGIFIGGIGLFAVEIAANA